MKDKRKVSPIVNTIVDVVIPIYGKLEFLEKCLACLPKAFEQTSFQVLALDNGSPDKGAQEIVLKAFPNARFQRLKENAGFPKGCNTAARWGRSPLILFLNTDAFMEPGSGDILVQDMIDDHKIGILGMQLRFTDDTPHGMAGNIQHAGLDINIRGEAVHTYLGWSPDNERVQEQCEPFAVTGAALMIRRELWNKGGGFWEEYGIGTWEDVDLCLTVRAMGYKIIYEPRAVGYHYVGASALENKIAYPLNENSQIFHYKWKGKINWSE